ncbi:MAG: hypothetical protein ACR2N6_02410 [Miltoncostaeaceae bacterium]
MAVIAVVILWAIFGAWLAPIVLAGGFVGMFALAVWALKRLGTVQRAPVELRSPRASVRGST